MCTFSTNHEELWAPIIEKAVSSDLIAFIVYPYVPTTYALPTLQYMKLMGGYDFPGSNSGIDLYTLTGWIPEHIFVEDKDFVASNVWHRLMGGQKYGMYRIRETSMMLAPIHVAYHGLY
jgi:calpain-7